MNTVWVVVAFVVAAAVFLFVTSWRRSDQPESLGVVSDQWIAEHRLGSGQDSRR
jgi:hypothetical protein